VLIPSWFSFPAFPLFGCFSASLRSPQEKAVFWVQLIGFIGSSRSSSEGLGAERSAEFIPPLFACSETTKEAEYFPHYEKASPWCVSLDEKSKVEPTKSDHEYCHGKGDPRLRIGNSLVIPGSQQYDSTHKFAYRSDRDQQAKEASLHEISPFLPMCCDSRTSKEAE
jgi:hypothetical protein